MGKIWKHVYNLLAEDSGYVIGKKITALIKRMSKTTWVVLRCKTIEKELENPYVIHHFRAVVYDEGGAA